MYPNKTTAFLYALKARWERYQKENPTNFEAREGIEELARKITGWSRDQATCFMAGIPCAG